MPGAMRTLVGRPTPVNRREQRPNMQISSTGKTTVRLDTTLEVLGDDGFASIGPSGLAHGNVLAVSPDARFAIHSDDTDRVYRTDLGSGERLPLGFQARAAAFADPGTLIVAVPEGGSFSLAEFDTGSWAKSPVTLPAATALAWPRNTACPVDLSDDWGTSSLSSMIGTRWGVAVAQGNGLLTIRWPDGRWTHWRVPRSGEWFELHAACHAQGVVVTSGHTNRAANIVWLDNSGRYYDAFDAEDYLSISACVPCGDGFVTQLSDELILFEGHPIKPVARCVVGGHVHALGVDPNAERLAIAGDGRSMIVEPPRVDIVLGNGDRDRDQMRRVAEPQDDPRLSYASIDDPDLGRVARPSDEGLAELSKRVQHDPSALVSFAGGFEVDPSGDLPAQLYRFTSRQPTIDRSLSQLQSIATRILADTEQDPFVAWCLREALPVPWRTLDIQAPVETWVRDHLTLVYEHDDEPDLPTIGLERLTLGADPTQTPAWHLKVARTQGPEQRIALHRLSGAQLLPGYRFDGEDSWDGTDGEKTFDVGIVSRTHGFVFSIRVTDANEQPILRGGAVFEPIELSDPDDLRRLYYAGADADGLFIGRRDGRWVVDLSPSTLEGARPTSKPSPMPMVADHLASMVSADQLALHSCPNDLVWKVEDLIFGRSEPESKTARRLENLLLSHDAVDDLFVDTDELSSMIVALRGATAKPIPKAKAGPKAKAVTIDGALAGRGVCLTGKFSSMKRSEATELCKANGARITASVTQSTDLLVVGEKPGSKLAKAEAMGIEVITEAELLTRLKPTP